MACQWITSFSKEKIQTPFVLAKDSEYYKDLRKRLTLFVKTLKDVSADKESVRIARDYADRICEAIIIYDIIPYMKRTPQESP